MTGCGGPIRNRRVGGSPSGCAELGGVGAAHHGSQQQATHYGANDETKADGGGRMEACMCYEHRSVNDIHLLCSITIVCPHEALPSGEESPVRGSLPRTNPPSARSDRKTE